MSNKLIFYGLHHLFSMFYAPACATRTLLISISCRFVTTEKYYVLVCVFSLQEPSSPWCKQKLQTELPPLTTDCMPTVGLSDQIELQTMVDAIAAASQREAESHETAIILTKENDDLRMKLKQLIEDNNRLIELYEQAVAERQNDIRVAENAQDNIREHSNQFTHLSQEKEQEMKTEVKNLEHQLMEMHEENENLLGLYEKAMQERNEFKRLLSSGGQKKNCNEGEYDCAEEKIVEVDGVERLKSDESSFPGNDSLVEEPDLFVSHAHVEGGENTHQFENSSSVSCKAEELLEETDLMEVQVQDEYSSCSSPRTSDYVDVGEPSSAVEAKNNVVKSVIFESNDQDGDIENFQIASNNLVIKSQSHTGGNISNDLNLVRLKLDKAQELLLNSSQTVALFGSLERANIEIDRLSGEIEALEDSAQMRRQECESSKRLSSELQERRNLLEKKLMAIKYSISSFSSSIGYFEQREVQARARTNSALTHLNQTQEKLARLHASRHEIEDAQRKMKISELEFKNNIADIKLKLEDENRRYENDKDKVLISIDNVDRTEIQAVLGGKATELLRSTEEKSKLQAEIMQAREKLGNTRTDIVKITRKLEKLDGEIQAVQVVVDRGLMSVEEMQNKLQSITQEKEAILEMGENGKSEYEYLLLEYHQRMFEAELKEEEMRILEEELQLEMKRVVELRAEKTMAMKKKTRRLQEVTMGDLCFVSDKVEEELQNVHLSFLELKSLLGDNISIYT